MATPRWAVASNAHQHTHNLRAQALEGKVVKALVTVCRRKEGEQLGFNVETELSDIKVNPQVNGEHGLV